MIKLLHGRCEDLLQQIPDKSVDAVIADPPYGTTKCKWDTPINLAEMWKQLNRIVKDRGVIILMAQTPFDKILGASNIKQLKYEWIWEKGNATGFLNAKKMPLKAHENALVFYNKLPTYNPQLTHGHPKKTTKRKTVNSECYGKALNLAEYESTSRYPRSVQFFSSDKQKNNFHPTQKPVSLMKFFIETYTNVGDHVLDFTMGSGTTGVACRDLGRSFTGIEKDFKYFLIAEQRIKSA